MSYCYIEAPNYIDLPKGQSSIFLAGGITGCEDWQSKACKALEQFGDITVVNPRRKLYDPSAGLETVYEQIKWEHHYLDQVHQVLFWFSSETVQPIVLFELGARLREYKWRTNVYNTHQFPHPQPTFIGCDPKYSRVWDVNIQANLERYSEPIKNNLDDLLKDVLEFNRLYKKLHY